MATLWLPCQVWKATCCECLEQFKRHVQFVAWSVCPDWDRSPIIDLNGPDIEAVDEVKELILESVNVWRNYKRRMPSRGSAGVTRPSRSVQGSSNVYCELSGLEDVVQWFHRMISFQKVMVKSWPCNLGDRGTEVRKRAEWAWCSWSTDWLQVWRRNLFREVVYYESIKRELKRRCKYECRCDERLQTKTKAENVPAIVNIKTLKGRFIPHKFFTGWAVWVVKSGKEECCWPVCCWPVCSVPDQFEVKYKPETYFWTLRLTTG